MDAEGDRTYDNRIHENVYNSFLRACALVMCDALLSVLSVIARLTAGYTNLHRVTLSCTTALCPFAPK